MTEPREALAEWMRTIVESARGSTLYCNWCGAKPESEHHYDCAAAIAIRALDEDETEGSR